MSGIQNCWKRDPRLHPISDFFQCAGGLLLFVMLCLPTVANGVDAKGNFINRGIGSGVGSCGEYAREDNIDYRRWYEHWATGYISGVNSSKRGKTDFSNGVAPKGLTQWLENYCRENPLTSFGSAVDAMLDELNKKKK